MPRATTSIKHKVTTKETSVSKPHRNSSLLSPTSQRPVDSTLDAQDSTRRPPTLQDCGALSYNSWEADPQVLISQRAVSS